MHIYYKYSDLFPLSYFDEPTIKISQIEHLNDPFEFNTSENILLSIKKYIKDMDGDDNLVSKALDVCKAEINAMIAYNGVVSFSETPRNSLMWAHYANQHHGICIGYNENVIEHITIDNTKKEDRKFLLVINKPKKVNYDNLRFDPEYIFKSDIREISREATTNHLLKKSDEWIYEKEHRCIVPFCSANILQLIRDDAKVDRRFRPTRRQETKLKPGTDYKLVLYYGLSNKLIDKSGDDNKYSIISSDPVQCDLLQSSKYALMLIKIDPSSIQSIHFGCHVSLETIKPYYEKLHKTYKLYKFEISKNRFELEPKLITGDMFIDNETPNGI